MDWGVPDWHGARAYQRYKGATVRQARWEYLRRQKLYRDDWLKTGKETQPTDVTPLVMFSPRANFYGMDVLCDPSWSYLHQLSKGADATPEIKNIATMVPPWDLDAFLAGQDEGAFRDNIARAQVNFQFVAFIDPSLSRKPQFERKPRD